jgi:putative hydrolase of the HAD superfamily
VRALFFDAVGTLIHPDPPAPIVYADVGSTHGSRLDAGTIATRFQSAFAREEEEDRRHGLRTSEEREVQRWRRIVATVLDDVTDPEACFAALFTHFSQPGAWRCIPEAGAVLEELSGRGYLLGIASNYDRRLRSVAAGLLELQPVRHLLISSEVGWRKPAPEFFAALGRAVDEQAEQITLIGDDLENDYNGARAAGLDAVLFDPWENYPEQTERMTRLTKLLTRYK